MPLFDPGMKPDLAEQKSVSPAKTHGLAVALGAMFFGRTARRWARSRTATPVNATAAPPGSAATWIVARAGVLPNSKRFAYSSFIARVDRRSVRYGLTKTRWRKSRPAALRTAPIASSEGTPER